MIQKLTTKQIVMGLVLGAIAISMALFLDRAGYIRLLPKSELEKASDEAAGGLNEVLIEAQEVAYEYERKRGEYSGEECNKLQEMRE